jgi:hypothetical protein
MNIPIVLLPSALLGGEAWSDVRAVLAARGHTASVAATRSAQTPQEAAAAYAAAVPIGDRVVLVPHSNAGLYVPQLAATRQVAACVFVDASLPPATGAAASATGRRREHLALMADADGLLPVWTDWWEEADLAELLPDMRIRRRVASGQTRLPLAYFDTPIPVPADWQSLPCAYLSFGGGQPAEVASATERGWPVEELMGHHLHLLTDPEEVATGIIKLVDRLLKA